MVNKVGELISVITVYNTRGKPLPCRLRWKGQLRSIAKVNLQYPRWEGQTLHHMFSVNDATLCFLLDFNTRTQQWMLEETSDGLPG